MTRTLTRKMKDAAEDYPRLRAEIEAEMDAVEGRNGPPRYALWRGLDPSLWAQMYEARTEYERASYLAAVLALLRVRNRIRGAQIKYLKRMTAAWRYQLASRANALNRHRLSGDQLGWLELKEAARAFQAYSNRPGREMNFAEAAALEAEALKQLKLFDERLEAIVRNC